MLTSCYGQISQEVQSTLNIIINSAQRLSTLVNDILDVQRLEYKNIKLELQSFDLNKVVSVIDVLSRPLLKNKQVRIINNVFPENYYVYADMNWTYQIIQNLISNACKYTYSGIIEISAELQGTATILIKITDTGIGITEENQKRIFEPFEQINPYGTENTGTGLGLSIAKRLVELQGGLIFLKSKEGKGSEFSFTLPAASPAELSISHAKDRMIKLRDFANKIHQFKNIDILIKELFLYIVRDEKVSVAAIFQNDRLIKCTSDNKQKYITKFEKWKIEGVIPDNYIFLDLEEIRSHLLMIELKPEATLLDSEYFMNLKSQAEIIVQNFKRLIGDVYFIDDIYIVANRKKYVRFIKTEDGQTALYEDENDSIIYLKSSLNTLECFFSDLLIRVNRFCLINPKKILGIDKEFDQTSKKNKITVNVDGEIITISDNMLSSFPDDIIKKFLK